MPKRPPLTKDQMETLAYIGMCVLEVNNPMCTYSKEMREEIVGQLKRVEASIFRQAMNKPLHHEVGE